MTDYYNPVRVIKTDDWLSELYFRIEDLNISSPIIITTPGTRNRLNLDSKFNSDSIFSDLNSNPNFADCDNVIKFCRENTFDGVIAIGGGSAMDLAKVVMAHLCLGESNIYNLIKYEKEYPRKIPSIFLPTTHGTGSEVTMWGTIWNTFEKKKYSISHVALYPNVAILDGRLTLSLPINISIITLLDTLSHSLESIWNKNANTVSTKYAITAIGTILSKVDDLKKKPNDIIIRNSLLEASNKAGLAFSNTKTAAAHSISYPLTMHYGIPHGIAASISLIPLLAINGPEIQDSLNTIYQNNNITNKQLIQFIKSIPLDIIPYSLEEWHIPKNQIPNLVNESFFKGRMENNIVDLTIDDVNWIFNEIYFT